MRNKGRNFTLAILCAVIVGTAATWTSVSAQDGGLFKVGNCWRPIGVPQSLAGSQFKGLEAVGPWVRTTEPATASIGSIWINTDQLPGAHQARVVPSVSKSHPRPRPAGEPKRPLGCADASVGLRLTTHSTLNFSSTESDKHRQGVGQLCQWQVSQRS